MPVNFEIRTASNKDKPAIYALHLASWQANYAHEIDMVSQGPDLERMLETKWRNRILSMPNLVLVACDAADANSILGFIFVQIEPGAVLIDNLHVSPQHTSKGVGHALLNCALSHLSKMNISEAFLDVFSSNSRAMDFYTRIGARQLHTMEAIVLGNRIQAVRLELKTSRTHFKAIHQR